MSDNTRVLDVKPLRCLSPIFTSPNDMSSLSTPQPSPFVSGTSVGTDDSTTSGRKKKKPNKPMEVVDVEPLLNQLLVSFRLVELDQVKKADGDKEVVRRILLVFDLFRRRMTQIDESSNGSGSGWSPKDGKLFDQKLEVGNLALENSLHRRNEIRPEAFKVWKTIQQWKYGVASRVGVILPDFTSGAESQPVCLVNDVDDEKGPAFFTYIPSLKYSKPFLMPRPSPGCHCVGGCQPGDSNCPCIQRNGGFLPYSSLGVLMSYKTLIHECYSACSCPPNCRN
ncbi:hypothetical protein RND71_037085 [Anisodus tanguticus]|uniref:Pre-SET domain-containing protein n=1 Tax=Anisodus tanguticus TaxID=243964 RepID=A0AAE1UYI2_9SOLA|nr:hypothetical protein RND71_037085 [Anisodus tanguticus]